MVRYYTASNPQSVVDPSWIFWSRNDFARDLAPEQVSSLLFITRKKEICVIYKPTPVFNERNELIAIIGNMFDESSSPAFFKIDKDDIGSCYAIREHNKVPTEFRPEIPLQADSVKETDWDDAGVEIALIAIPNIVPIPFGTEINSTTADDDFTDEMKKISDVHGFWAQTMGDVVDQFETDNHTETVFKRLISSTIVSSSRDPARAATKGIRGMTFASSPFLDASLLGKNSYEADKEKLKAFFHRNPTPVARASSNDDATVDNDKEVPQVPVHSASASAHPPKEFYAQMIEMMKKVAAPAHPSKIIVESRDHEETIDLAKLQTAMLQLFYATGEINWDDGSAKNIKVANFSQGFRNLLARSVSVQATQLNNLFITIFQTEPDDDDDENHSNPLNRLMSLVVFPPKFTKGHLNASFQSSDLETGSLYKSTNINPFLYAPQGNRKMIKEAATKMEEERNEINWRIVEKDRNKISSMIEGVGRVNNMEEVAMTCANMCGVQLAMIDIAAGKPILYQFAWKVIRLIENKKTKTWMRDNADRIAHLPMFFMAKIHQVFMHLASFSQNSINTNKIELGNDDFDTKMVVTAVKLASKFFSKVQEHIDDNSFPKDVPAFARGFFADAAGGGFVQAPTIAEQPPANTSTRQPAEANPNGKRKPYGEEQEGGKKKPRKEFSDKSLKMGLFHIKKGIPLAKAMPDKSTLKDGASICLDFCSHERKCNFTHLLCKNGKHYTNWKNVPDDDKMTLLKHMSATGLMWLDAETFTKHGITIAPEFVYLLGDATGPRPKTKATST